MSFPALGEKIWQGCMVYIWGMSAMLIMSSDSWPWWTHYLSAAGLPCFFIGFYGPAFLLAWIDWKKIPSAAA
jgi:hypothetical protein